MAVHHSRPTHAAVRGANSAWRAAKGRFLPWELRPVRLSFKDMISCAATIRGSRQPATSIVARRMPRPSAPSRRMAHSHPYIFRLLLIAVAASCASIAGAQPPQVINREYEIKAGYFAYFGKLITWPQQSFPGADREFVIAVLGSNPFRQHLIPNGNNITLNAGRVNVDRIQGKGIRLHEYQSADDLERNYRPCHILFVCRSGAQGESVQRRVQAALAIAKGQPTLVVAEATSIDAAMQLARSGVMICYWNDTQTNQVRMLVNRDAERREKLNISARLLGLRLVQVL